MTVIEVAQKAASRLAMEIPTTLYTNTERTWVEMGNMINTAARQILDEYDWERLKKIEEITGDGTTEDFDFPEFYDRMTRDARLWSVDSPWWNVGQIAPEGWLALESSNSNLSWRSVWTIFGGQIHIREAPTTVIRYFYISNAIVNAGTQREFTADSDTFVLDERLLLLSTLWNWKKVKGLDFAPELQEYQEALSYCIGKDKGPRRIYEGSGRGGFVPDIFAAVWGR